MEKIVFNIPKNTSKSESKIEQKTTNETNCNNININKLNELFNKNVVNKNVVNYNEYIKITENVYKFNQSDNSEDNIYVIFNKACDYKHIDKIKAIEYFKKCESMINNDIKLDTIYEIFINLALLISESNGSSDDIFSYYNKAISVYSDRAEPYYYWGLYCNKIGNFEKAYDLFKSVFILSYDDAKIKYPDTQFTAYGKHILDELAVACYWLKKYDEAQLILENIINDPDFTDHKERLESNLKFTKESMLNM